MNINRLTQAIVFLAVLGCVSASVLAIGTPPPSVPDGGSSALLLGGALGGTAMLRRFFARK